MNEFWDFVKLLAVINGTLIALFLILLSLPQSRLGQIFLKVFGIVNLVIAGILIVYVISPIDLIPDAIPALGQTDDIAGLIGIIIDTLIGYISLKKSKMVESKTIDSKP